MAGGGMKRDRVPAMLEPGEFVMRKEAVKQAGVGTMMRMNAAPQQLQSGGKVMQGNATYSVARAMELEAMGLSPAQARSVAQEEADRSKSVGGAFSFSDNVINSMRRCTIYINSCNTFKRFKRCSRYDRNWQAKFSTN